MCERSTHGIWTGIFIGRLTGAFTGVLTKVFTRAPTGVFTLVFTTQRPSGGGVGVSKWIFVFGFVFKQFLNISTPPKTHAYEHNTLKKLTNTKRMPAMLGQQV